MALVFGLGAGLFSTIVVWILGLFGCVVLSRSSRGSKGGAFGVAVLVVIVTVVLVLYPRKSINEESLQASQANVDVDNLAIPRVVFFVFICLFALIALVMLMLFHWLEPVYTPAVVAKRTYTF